ncbi:MAG: 4-hydroxythreonine-4-phosphate dehydrogenase PdxA [Bradymonadaceae bacterium]|nr:4-hydroxythreonine-4-phosphate dehydrogenase PdxA [Lujinxingiaceae bacterium]
MNIGISIGDPGGIGPEVILKTLQEPLPEDVRAVIFGSIEVLEREDQRLSRLVPNYRPLRAYFRPQMTLDSIEADTITVVEVCPQLDLSTLPTGRHDARAAMVQLEALIGALNAVAVRKLDAIVTAPWTKELFQTIGKPVVGHTEILAAHFKAPEVVMMLAGARLRVALVTTHVALADVSTLVSGRAIQSTITTTVKDLARLFGIERPRIGVCALNPHAGEGGAMGNEEIEIIAPALEELRREGSLMGAEIVGPLPADTLFARYGKEHAPFDAVICMYHDQGLIPLKLLHFGQSANFTLGLPIVRTSVDHGTAYDIAGKGIADAGSMRYALLSAIQMAERIKVNQYF